jgi:hypothetical protein
MTDDNTYIVYYTCPLRIQKTTVVPLKKGDMKEPAVYPEAQSARVEAFIQDADLPKTILESYCDRVRGRRNKHWPELIKATEACQCTGAILLIAELGHLTANAYFMEILLGAGVPLYCCDQNFMTVDILAICHQHLRHASQLQGQAISAGLDRNGWARGSRKRRVPTEIAEALEA